MRTFLLGYNIESGDETRPGVVEQFLRTASALHRDLALPFTFFIRGKTLEAHPHAFRRVRDECGDLVDLQQHTYAGLPLKTVCQENHKGIQVFRGLSPEQCRDSLARTNDLMRDILGVRPVGLGAPLGHYRGLADELMILEVLQECGIRFVRSWTRNAHDWSPLSFEAQPFVYDRQGFPGIMEIPGQGWPDHLLRDALGLAEVEKYVQHMCKDLDYVAARELTWSCVAHDWASVLEDPGMHAVRAILEHAQRLDFRILTHRAYYEENVGPVADAAAAQPAGTEAGHVLASNPDAAPARRCCCAWRCRRMRLRAKAVRRFRKPAWRRLMRKAGSVHQRKLLATLGR